MTIRFTDTGSPISVTVTMEEDENPSLLSPSLLPTIFNDTVVEPTERTSFKYEQLRYNYDLDNIYEVTYGLILGATFDCSDNSVELLEKLESIVLNILELSNDDTDKLSLNKYEWFTRDYFRYYKYSTDPDTGVPIRTRCGPRVYYWEDAVTDYDGLAIEMIEALIILDTWFKETYTDNNIEHNNSLVEIIDWYDLMHKFYNEVCNDGELEGSDIDEKPDSIS